MVSATVLKGFETFGVSGYLKLPFSYLPDSRDSVLCYIVQKQNVLESRVKHHTKYPNKLIL